MINDDIMFSRTKYEPNMNPSLHVKLSNRNFLSWKTKIVAYLRG